MSNYNIAVSYNFLLQFQVSIVCVMITALRKSLEFVLGSFYLVWKGEPKRYSCTAVTVPSFHKQVSGWQHEWIRYPFITANTHGTATMDQECKSLVTPVVQLLNPFEDLITQESVKLFCLKLWLNPPYKFGVWRCKWKCECEIHVVLFATYIYAFPHIRAFCHVIHSRSLSIFTSFSQLRFCLPRSLYGLHLTFSTATKRIS